VSCQTQDASGKVTSCPGWALGIGLLSFVVVTVATALILALVYRSIAEWNEKRES
jgi:hypothetical protein